MQSCFKSQQIIQKNDQNYQIHVIFCNDWSSKLLLSNNHKSFCLTGPGKPFGPNFCFGCPFLIKPFNFRNLRFPVDYLDHFLKTHSFFRNVILLVFSRIDFWKTHPTLVVDLDEFSWKRSVSCPEIAISWSFCYSDQCIFDESKWILKFVSMM